MNVCIVNLGTCLHYKNEVKTSYMCHNKRADTNFIDTIGTFICQNILEDIEKCLKTLLMDRSTDSSITDQDLIYVLILDSK